MAQLPAAPLQSRIRLWMRESHQPLEGLAEAAKVSERELVRILAGDVGTITLDIGDKIALALELHPALIWPDEWWWPTGKAYEALDREAPGWWLGGQGG